MDADKNFLRVVITPPFGADGPHNVGRAPPKNLIPAFRNPDGRRGNAKVKDGRGRFNALVGAHVDLGRRGNRVAIAEFFTAPIDRDAIPRVTQ